MLADGSLEFAWIEAKVAEEMARDKRLEIEALLIESYQIDTAKPGTTEIVDGLKITCSVSRKVDDKKLQELANEHGLSSHLGTLFRWKPEIDSRAWKATHTDITSILEGAIETRPAKPSFSYKQKETK